MIEDYDIHDWIIAKEVGKNGYKHIQARIRTNKGLDGIKKYLPEAHCEESGNWCTYERKAGHYLTSEDTADIRKTRFGRRKPLQERILQEIANQNDREIHVWVDVNGGVGKSWLCNHLYECGRGFYCPPYLSSPKDIIQFICSGYAGEETIIVDIPRTWKWTEALYITVEAVKDGLICDTRYSAKTRNIRGAKILVLTNQFPKLGKLSMDRWKIIDNEALVRSLLP